MTPVQGEVLPPETLLDDEGFAVGARPLCPFCSRAWSARMMEMFAEASALSGYYGEPSGVELVIDISCDSCDRLIYRKEVQDEFPEHWRGHNGGRR